VTESFSRSVIPHYAADANDSFAPYTEAVHMAKGQEKKATTNQPKLSVKDKKAKKKEKLAKK
jgi:hypothetical protein